MINGHQCTITWWVDDIKISYRSRKVIDEIVKTLEKIFGKLRSQRGPKITYLGIDIYFSVKGKIVTSMVQYLRETVNEFKGKC